MRRGQPDQVDNYINQLFAPEDSQLSNIRESLRKDDMEGINVGPYEGKLLQFLVGLSGAKRVVEVGLLYGYSTLWMARALPEDGMLYSFEKDPKCYEKAKSLLEASNVSNKVELVLGDAEENLKKLDGPVDMVFIDANKGAYEKYLDWAETNVKKGGLIIGDNTFLFGHIFEGAPEGKMSEKTVETMRNFNKRLADPEKYRSVLIPTSEGLTVAQKMF